MKTVIQRVLCASVEIEGKETAKIKQGILTLLGIEKGDSEDTVKKVISKILDLRIFSDTAGKMNLSVRDIEGEHLLISQFTLLGNCSKGKRPSFEQAEKPDRAKELYELAIKHSTELGIPTKSGVFAADMKINLINDGPVTFFISETII